MDNFNVLIGIRYKQHPKQIKHRDKCNKITEAKLNVKSQSLYWSYLPSNTVAAVVLGHCCHLCR